MLPERFPLPNGGSVLIRPIRPDDKARLEDGLRRLSVETIRRRFLAAKPAFSAAELRYLTEIDHHSHIALVATDEDGDLVAVARAVRTKPDTMEMAVVVGDPLQGQALGRELAARLSDLAQEQGIRYFAATMAGENLVARRLIRSVARRFEERPPSNGLREMVAELAPHAWHRHAGAGATAPEAVAAA